MVGWSVGSLVEKGGDRATECISSGFCPVCPEPWLKQNQRRPTHPPAGRRRRRVQPPVRIRAAAAAPPAERRRLGRPQLPAEPPGVLLVQREYIRPRRVGG